MRSPNDLLIRIILHQGAVALPPGLRHPSSRTGESRITGSATDTRDLRSSPMVTCSHWTVSKPFVLSLKIAWPLSGALMTSRHEPYGLDGNMP